MSDFADRGILKAVLEALAKTPPAFGKLGASSGCATAAKQVLATKAVLSSTASLTDGSPSF
jgi:hypothetical protein